MVLIVWFLKSILKNILKFTKHGFRLIDKLYFDICYAQKLVPKTTITSLVNAIGNL